MKSCISFGKIEVKYFIMIFISLATLLMISISFNIFSKDKEKYIGYLGEYKENNKFLKSFLKYFGQTWIILGEIIRKKVSFKKNEKEINSLNKKDFFFIIVVALAVLLDEFLAIFLKIHTNTIIYLDERYNSIEFIFLFMTSLIIFKIRYYKHQYLSIIIIIISELLRYIIILIKVNQSQNINPFLEFGLQIIRAVIDSLFLGYSKALMEYKFFSPYRATYIFGTICLIIVILLYIILSIMPVKDSHSYCFVKYKDKCYIDNFLSIFSGFSIVQFLCLFCYSLAGGVCQLLFNFIVKDFTMCHTFLYYQVSALYLSFTKNKINIFILIVIIITAVIELFISFIFLEILQVNICGLNKNVKINIEQRAIEDCKDLYHQTSINSVIDINDEYCTEMTEQNIFQN